MKCEHCGWDDKGTGDSGHFCPSFNTARYVPSESQAKQIAAFNRRTPLTEQSQERDEPQLCAPFIGMDQPWTAGKVAEFDAALALYETEQPQERDTCKACDAKQAKIDALMLEYCPDEMTPEQVAEWGEHQVAVELFEGKIIYASPRTKYKLMPTITTPLDAQAIRRKALKDCVAIVVNSDSKFDAEYRMRALIDKTGEA